MSRAVKGTFSLSWDNPEAAEEVAYVLQSAALGKDGKVRDHGFMQDATSLFKQISQRR